MSNAKCLCTVQFTVKIFVLTFLTFMSVLGKLGSEIVHFMFFIQSDNVFLSIMTIKVRIFQKRFYFCIICSFKIESGKNAS